MRRGTSLLICVTALFVALGLSTTAWADTMVVFEYPFDHSVLVTAESTQGKTAAGVMIGAGAQTTEVPLAPGSYTLRISRIEDFSIADVQRIQVEETETQRIELAQVRLSAPYQLEDTRNQFIRAAAVESTLAFRRQRTGRLRWISLGTGLVAGAGAAGAYWYGQGLYKDYQNATTTSEASNLRGDVELMAGLAIGLGAGAGVGLITGLIAQIVMPSIDEARDQRRERQRSLEAAEAERGTWPDHADEGLIGAQGVGE
jgi:hypothetical protein